ncbi:hypothetical protein EVAR_28483_1 [Eumeta japonica]|uniref:Uncharacterized protein n=1 Tax=Eumeta variegata TaxID=151549 RepID=A0A4C1WPD2_EUMVA|nr:hypothetical protein EVAR_28483_1 [Eumeta japonica]
MRPDIERGRGPAPPPPAAGPHSQSSLFTGCTLPYIFVSTLENSFHFGRVLGNTSARSELLTPVQRGGDCDVITGGLRPGPAGKRMSRLWDDTRHNGTNSSERFSWLSHAVEGALRMNHGGAAVIQPVTNCTRLSPAEDLWRFWQQALKIGGFYSSTDHDRYSGIGVVECVCLEGLLSNERRTHPPRDSAPPARARPSRNSTLTHCFSHLRPWNLLRSIPALELKVDPRCIESGTKWHRERHPLQNRARDSGRVIKESESADTPNGGIHGIPAGAEPRADYSLKYK